MFDSRRKFIIRDRYLVFGRSRGLQNGHGKRTRPDENRGRKYRCLSGESGGQDGNRFGRI